MRTLLSRRSVFLRRSHLRTTRIFADMKRAMIIGFDDIIVHRYLLINICVDLFVCLNVWLLCLLLFF